MDNNNKPSDLILPKNSDITPRERYYLEGESKSIQYLPEVNDINIFIGSNNSGKSSFMRYLMNDKPTEYKTNLHKFLKLVYEYNLKIKDLPIILPTHSISSTKIEFHQIHYNWNDSQSNLQTINTIELELQTFKRLEKHEKNIENLKKAKPIGHNITRQEFDSILHLKNQLREILSILPKDSVKAFSKSIYIPALRTSHALTDKEGNRITEDFFKDTIFNKYNLNLSVEVFTGLSLYDEIIDSRNATREKRDKFHEFEKFLSQNFFKGVDIDIVSQMKKKSVTSDNSEEVILVDFNGETSTKKLYQLGDGIQALIILLYKIFMAKNNSFFYIDEPELNLHPGMQRLFLEQIIKLNQTLEDRAHTYFITTHSNHFLDLTLETKNISIFSFKSTLDSSGENKFIIKNVNHGNNELLRELGVNTSSVFLANCCIWVEGISDRLLIKAFILAYLKEKNSISIKEDIDYTFFEYSGSNITHYYFREENEIDEDQDSDFRNKIKSFTLSNKIFLLADSDCAQKGEKKFTRLNELEKMQCDNFTPKIIWGFREIENLIPNRIWQHVLINFTKVSPNDNTQDLINSALEHNNSLDYKEKYIGEFLLKIKESVPTLKKIWKTSEGGTLNNKKELSETILNYVIKNKITWADFKENPEIIKLTKEIVTFIQTK